MDYEERRDEEQLGGLAEGEFDEFEDEDLDEDESEDANEDELPFEPDSL